jgi:hypothetical protein
MSHIVNAEVEGVRIELEISEGYVKTFEDIVEKDSWNGPVDIDEWAAMQIKENSGQIGSLIERGIFNLDQQLKTMEEQGGM